MIKTCNSKFPYNYSSSRTNKFVLSTYGEKWKTKSRLVKPVNTCTWHTKTKDNQRLSDMLGRDMSVKFITNWLAAYCNLSFFPWRTSATDTSCLHKEIKSVVCKC